MDKQAKKSTREDKVHISVVTPVYGHQLNLNELFTRLRDTLIRITEDFEIIMVNDASPDNAWEVIKNLATKDPRVKGIDLSRNFGQHHAITAGLDCACGEWIVVMDCDLQDKPEEIEKLYQTAQGGYDIVLGQRTKRKDSFLKKIFSRLFYGVLRYLSDIDHDPSIANFGIYSRKVIDSVILYKEQFRSFGIFVHLVGFRKTCIPVEHAARTVGKSSYPFRKKWDLAIDSIVANSNKSLRLSIKFGFMVFALSITYAGWIVVRFISHGIGVTGWTSIMVSIYLISGLLFMNIGFLGLYLGKVFEETKKRPLYIIRGTTFDK